MTGLVAGIYKICSSLMPVATAILILMLAVAGIGTIIAGAEGHARLKENLKNLVIGAAIVFGSTALGKEIASWFMG